MPNVCTVFRHERRVEIDKALISGKPLRALAEQTGTSVGALHRHKTVHISTAIAKARSKSQDAVLALAREKQAAQDSEANTVFDRLQELNRETQAILRAARESGDNEVALKAIARVERQLELEARLIGEIDQRVQLAVGLSISQSTEIRNATTLAAVLTREELEALRMRFLAWEAGMETASDIDYVGNNQS